MAGAIALHGCETVGGGRPFDQKQQASSGVRSLDVKVPAQVGLFGAVLSAEGRLAIADRVRIESGIASNLGTQSTDLGVDSILDRVVSRAAVTFHNRAKAMGDATSSGTIFLKHGAEIQGVKSEHATISEESNSWQVTLPDSDHGAIQIEPDQSFVATPGDYSTLNVKSRATATLSSGTYSFKSVFVEPGAHLLLDDSQGPVFVYVRDTLLVKASPESIGGDFPKFLLGYFGTNSVHVEAPFRGTIVAPAGTLVLSGPTLEGSFYAKDIEVRPDTVIKHAPFTHWMQNTLTDFDGDRVPDTSDNCPVNQNPLQSDSDGDGLGDACDSCHGGVDQDSDGVCDDVDNCPESYNPNQKDVNLNSVGEACDVHSCVTTLEPSEVQLAIQALINAHSDEISENSALISQSARCVRDDGSQSRVARVVVYDQESQNAYLAAVALSTGDVLLFEAIGKDAQVSEAEAIAAEAAVMSSDVTDELPPFDTVSSEIVTAPIGGCDVERCVGVVLAMSAADATLVPRQGYAPEVKWRGGSTHHTIFVRTRDYQVVGWSPTQWR